MTRKQIFDRVARNLNELGLVYYTPTDIIESIQDGYDEVAVYSECIERTWALLLRPNTTYYDMFTEIPDYYRLIRAYNPKINGTLVVYSDRQELQLRQDWELGTSTPRDVMILGPRYLGIAGRITVDSDIEVKLWYKAQANQLANDADIPRINTKYQVLLEHYATADLLEQNQEFVKAETYWAQYEKKLNEYRFKIQLLSKADRVFSRPAEGLVYSGDLRAYNTPESIS